MRSGKTVIPWSTEGANVYAFRADPETGSLTELNHVPAMGPNPTDLAVDPSRRVLYTAPHGGFEHIEKIIQTADCKLGLTYEYDSAATAMYELNEDGSTGEVLEIKLHELDRIPTTADGFSGRNEPATLRVHPNGNYIYVNNRGEDTIVTVEADADGRLTRRCSFPLGKSADPAIATRQMELTPDARYLFVAERPAYVIRVLEIHGDGTLTDVASTPVENPVYICFAQLG